MVGMTLKNRPTPRKPKPPTADVTLTEHELRALLSCIRLHLNIATVNIATERVGTDSVVKQLTKLRLRLLKALRVSLRQG